MLCKSLPRLNGTINEIPASQSTWRQRKLCINESPWMNITVHSMDLLKSLKWERKFNEDRENSYRALGYMFNPFNLSVRPIQILVKKGRSRNMEWFVRFSMNCIQVIRTHKIQTFQDHSLEHQPRRWIKKTQLITRGKQRDVYVYTIDKVIGLNNGLIVTQELKVDLVLGLISFQRGEIKAKNKATTVALRALN